MFCHVSVKPMDEKVVSKPTLTAGHLILNFSASRTRRNLFLLCVSHLV